MTEVRGIVSPLVTPFDAQGQVNADMARQLVRFHLSVGITGFYVCGSTGEGLLMDPPERKLMLETVIDEVKKRVPVIAHIGAIATHVAADLADHAAEAGADAVASIPPIYFPMDIAAIKAYYKAIADAARDLPVWIYNIPRATGVSITADTLKHYLEIPQIRGVKYTAQDLADMHNMIEIGQDRGLTVMSGPDDLCLPALVMGVHGAIGTTYNIMPGHYVRLYEAFRNGDLKTAQRLQYEANHVIKAFLSVPALPAIKEILRGMGFDCGQTRAPLRPLTDAEREHLWKALEAARFADLVDVPLAA